MKFEHMHPADQLVAMMNRIYSYGMTTTSGGNLSICDENGDIWITPSGVDKGSLTREDIMQVKPDGSYIGRHKPSVEFPFHRDIYRCRGDIRAVVHAHPPVLVGYSLLHRSPDTRILPEVYALCGDVAQVPYNAPGTKELGENVAARFKEGYNTVLMANHGVTCGAADLHSAFVAFEAVTNSAQTEIYARRLGVPRSLSEVQLACALNAGKPLPEADEEYTSLPEEAELRRSMCAFARRCYDRGLVSSAHGTISVRLSDGSMLIYPAAKDRLHLQEDDIVRVCDGKVEPGKIPGENVRLHMGIYASHPEIGCVMLSHAPSVMAYAATGVEFDSRLISEGYIILGDVRRLECASGAPDGERIVNMLEARKNIIVVDNRFALVTGKSLINAFDRLEVLECGAAAVLAALELGAPVSLSSAEIEETCRALGL